MDDQLGTVVSCYCENLSDLAVVPMGGDRLDERVFAYLDLVKEHGGDQWWLYISHCKNCGQHWMVAQDERIYDNYYMRRLDRSTAEAIQENGQWPLEFMTYERVLSLGRTLSTPWTFLDPISPGLVWTAEDLRRERPTITIEEIAYLLAIPVKNAKRLLRKPTLIDRIRSWACRL